MAVGKISAVEVWNGEVGTGVRVMRVDYKYFDDDMVDAVADWSNDVGKNGDLIQVKVSIRASNDGADDLSIVRYTQYRYESGVWNSVGYSNTNLGR